MFFILKINKESSQTGSIGQRYVSGMRIRIRTKMSRIPNIEQKHCTVQYSRTVHLNWQL
jgi:hypothetical protein